MHLPVQAYTGVALSAVALEYLNFVRSVKV